MRTANQWERQPTRQRRRHRRVLRIVGELRLPERPERWELDVIVQPLLERLREAALGGQDGDEQA